MLHRPAAHVRGGVLPRLRGVVNQTDGVALFMVELGLGMPYAWQLRLMDRVLTTRHWSVLMDSMNSYQILSITNLDKTSIVTIAEVGSMRTWTYVTTADGEDMLVSPEGAHYSAASDIDRNSTVTGLIAWIVENV